MTQEKVMTQEWVDVPLPHRPRERFAEDGVESALRRGRLFTAVREALAPGCPLDTINKVVSAVEERVSEEANEIVKNYRASRTLRMKLALDTLKWLNDSKPGITTREQREKLHGRAMARIMRDLGPQ